MRLTHVIENLYFLLTLPGKGCYITIVSGLIIDATILAKNSNNLNYLVREQMFQTHPLPAVNFIHKIHTHY